MLENIQHISIPDERRDAINSVLDKGYSLSDVLACPAQEQIELLQTIQGYQVGFRKNPVREAMLAREEQYTLRTVNGEPLGEVKIGLRQFRNTREERHANMRGISSHVTREFPERFSVGCEMAVHLLRMCGYGLRYPRYSNRTAGPNEIDCQGNPVKAKDNWLLVEEGSQFEELAIKNGDLKPIKKERTRGRNNRDRSGSVE